LGVKFATVNVDLSAVTPVSAQMGDSDTDSSMLLTMASDARRFLESFEWCKAVSEQYFGMGVGGVVAVFLCRITPATAEVDEWLWVVVGDVPFAFLVTEEAPTPLLALNAYVREMERWVQAAKTGGPVDDLIPVNVAATSEWGSRLESRLAFIRSEILRSRG